MSQAPPEVRPAPQASQEAAGHGAMPFSPGNGITAKLANGVTATLLGLFAGRDANDLRCWCPDGTPVSPEQSAQFTKGLGASLSFTNILETYGFAYLLLSALLRARPFGPWRA